jgi:hypothetical protein
MCGFVRPRDFRTTYASVESPADTRSPSAKAFADPTQVAQPNPSPSATPGNEGRKNQDAAVPGDVPRVDPALAAGHVCFAVGSESQDRDTLARRIAQPNVSGQTDLPPEETAQIHKEQNHMQEKQRRAHRERPEDNSERRGYQTEQKPIAIPVSQQIKAGKPAGCRDEIEAEVAVELKESL